MSHCIVRGIPASHAEGLAAQARRLLLLSALGLVFLGASLVLVFRFSPERLVGTAVLAAPFLALGGYGFQRYQGEYARAMSGVRAERAVAKVLEATGPAVLLNGVVLGAGDIDHVVLGPVAVAVETKYGRGRISMDRKGRLVVGTKTLPRDPVSQAARNASMLSKRLGVSVTALVVISDGSGQPFSSRGVYVSSLTDLPAVLRSLPQVLTTVPRSAAALPVASERPAAV